MVLKSLTLINVFAKILSYFGIRKYYVEKMKKSDILLFNDSSRNFCCNSAKNLLSLQTQYNKSFFHEIPF